MCLRDSIGGGYNNRGNFWEMTVVTLGVVFCDTGKVTTKEERLEWPVTDEERHSEKGWERFQNEQICRLKIRQMKEEWAKDLVSWPWCISQVVKAHEDCPEPVSYTHLALLFALFLLYMRNQGSYQG